MSLALRDHDKLGKGGMGQANAALDTNLSPQVAITIQADIADETRQLKEQFAAPS